LTASVAEVTAMDPDEDRKLADLSEMPVDSTLLVTLRDGFDEVEAILTRLDGEVACWTNYCHTGRTSGSTKGRVPRFATTRSSVKNTARSSIQPRESAPTVPARARSSTRSR
jgi:hypothetical protein